MRTRNLWAAMIVGVLFAATFTLVANAYIGAACGVIALLTTTFILDERIE